MERVLVIVIFIGSIACNAKRESGSFQKFDLGNFSFDAPQSWKLIEKRGIDSYVGLIAIDDLDTLSFDLGWYSNELHEEEPVLLDSSIIGTLDPKYIDTSCVIFVTNDKLVDKERYKRNNIRWDTIDNRLAKIIFPVKSGKGTTGVYIDSLWVSGSSIDRFNLYGVNLQPANEVAVLKAIQTLRFKQK